MKSYRVKREWATDEPIAFTLTVPIEEERHGKNSGEAQRECHYTLMLIADGEDAEVILRAFGRKP